MAAILRENEQMPWTELSGASFVFAFLDSRLCKQIGKNAGVLFYLCYIMGLTLRCRRYIFLGCSLHLELVHGLTSLGNVQLVVVLRAHIRFSPLLSSDENTSRRKHFLFRRDSLTSCEICMNVNWRKVWGIMENLKVYRNLTERQKRHLSVAFLRRLYNKKIMKSWNGSKL